MKNEDAEDCANFWNMLEQTNFTGDRGDTLLYQGIGKAEDLYLETTKIIKSACKKLRDGYSPVIITMMAEYKIYKFTSMVLTQVDQEPVYRRGKLTDGKHDCICYGVLKYTG